MASAARIAANRANAQKSTGPRTEQGKARSCRNAIKHGILSQMVARQDESFPDLVNDLTAAFLPHNMAQQLLVEQLACAYAKFSHVQRFSLQVLSRPVFLDEDHKKLQLLIRY
jgi:hypothetical protein